MDSDGALSLRTDTYNKCSMERKFLKSRGRGSVQDNIT